MIRLLPLALVLGAVQCSGQTAILPGSSAPETIAPVDSARVLADLYFLSSPALRGRAVGSAGNTIAREYIVNELDQAGVEPFDGDWIQEFPLGSNGSTSRSGGNVVGFLRGTTWPDRYIVITAHFDHLGARDGTIYHGADDNASGTAALLEIARYFAEAPPSHSLIFAALDAEEAGLRGATAFIEQPPVPLDSMVLNVNMDMVGRNEQGELYAAGTYHYPALAEFVDSAAALSQLTLLRGHDSPDVPPGDDWTLQSDHGAFHRAGIPFIYFGVEDHPDYHRPTDTFENIEPGFFVAAVRTVLGFVEIVDGEGLVGGNS